MTPDGGDEAYAARLEALSPDGEVKRRQRRRRAPPSSASTEPSPSSTRPSPLSGSTLSGPAGTASECNATPRMSSLEPCETVDRDAVRFSGDDSHSGSEVHDAHVILCGPTADSPQQARLFSIWDERCEVAVQTSPQFICIEQALGFLPEVAPSGDLDEESLACVQQVTANLDSFREAVAEAASGIAELGSQAKPLSTKRFLDAMATADKAGREEGSDGSASHAAAVDVLRMLLSGQDPHGFSANLVPMALDCNVNWVQAPCRAIYRAMASSAECAAAPSRRQRRNRRREI